MGSVHLLVVLFCVTLLSCLAMRPARLQERLAAFREHGDLFTKHPAVRDILQRKAEARHKATPGSPLPYPTRNANFTYAGYNVTMRDGVKLYVGVFTPVSVKPPAAVVYEQTPYGAELGGPFNMVTFMYSEWQALVANIGAPTILVLQDVRGRENSTGEFQVLQTTRQDATDTMQWISKQSWSNGVIYSWGDSAMGITSYMTLGAEPPVMHAYLKGQSALVGSPNVRESIYEHGAFRNAISHEMSIIFNQSDMIPKIWNKEAPSSWWNALDLWSDNSFKQISFPTIAAAGWWDVFLEPGVDAFNSILEEAPSSLASAHRFIIEPNGHCPGTDIMVKYNKTAGFTLMIYYYGLSGLYWNIFSEAVNPITFGLALAEWNALLSIVLPVPRIIWYVWTGVDAGEGPGHYLTGADKLPTANVTSYYFGKYNALVTSPLETGSYPYVYDPTNPVKSLGGDGFGRFNPAAAPPVIKPYCYGCGPWDQLLLGNRSDIIRLDGDVLGATTAITGKITATLFVSSNCTDTDFVIKLVDVLPNTTRLEVQEGVVRMRWRDHITTPQKMTPGQVYTVKISLRFNSWIFQKGHRIGVDLTSSNYPKFDANPNTGDFLNTTQPQPPKVASNAIYFGSEHPSRIDLPIVQLDQHPHWSPPFAPPIPPIFAQ